MFRVKMGEHIILRQRTEPASQFEGVVLNKEGYSIKVEACSNGWTKVGNTDWYNDCDWFILQHIKNKDFEVVE